jgi:hypothetical protein
VRDDQAPDVRAAGRAEFLLNWIERSKLDVQKIVPVHGVAATMDDLRKAVARRNGSR